MANLRQLGTKITCFNSSSPWKKHKATSKLGSAFTITDFQKPSALSKPFEVITNTRLANSNKIKNGLLF